jgi:hypothetical protein
MKIGVAVFAGCLSALLLWSAVRGAVVWTQCRAFGFSEAYCMQMVAGRL